MSLINKKADGTIINQFSYTYDPVGNQKTKMDIKGITTYTYDALNHAEKVIEPSGTETSFSYDSNGNISNKFTEDSIADETDLNYSYSYNSYDQLTGYENSDKGTEISFDYYPNGLRYAKYFGTNNTTFYYDNQNVIIETINGNLSARNIFGIGLLGRQDSDGSIYYYLYNGHGDVVTIVDKDGNVVNTYDYDIYGNIREISEDIPNPIMYAGQYFDNETGLYYLRARYYDPDMMRFISEDSYKGDMKDPLSLNLYVYCQGNPILYLDIDGHMAIPNWIKNMINGIKAHKAIQLHVIKEMGLGDKDGKNGRTIKRNYFIQGAGINGNYGFADLYDIESKEVWEIKPNKATYMVFDKLQQINEYVRNIEGAKHGKVILGGNFKATGEDGTVYEVYQYEQFPGMMYYTVKENESKVSNSSTHVNNISIISMLLMMFKLLKGGGGTRVFVPV